MNVYILDDEQAMRRLLVSSVERLGYDATEFSSTGEFQAALPTLHYGCVLLDIAMPDRCGLDLLDDLQNASPAWPVIMVSGTTDVDHAIIAFRQGAVQFLRKPFRQEELASVLRAAATIVVERSAAAERQRQGDAMALTTREREVLNGINCGEQTKVIAWKLGLSARTIDMHRTNILTKLSARNATHAIAIARDLGLLSA